MVTIDFKENNAMKLEAEYRANLNQVYEEVKKRLVSVPNLLSPFSGIVKVYSPNMNFS